MIVTKENSQVFQLENFTYSILVFLHLFISQDSSVPSRSLYISQWILIHGYTTLLGLKFFFAHKDSYHSKIILKIVLDPTKVSSGPKFNMAIVF